MEKAKETETAFLKKYDPHKYERPSVTVDTLIFAQPTNEAQPLYNKDKELWILLIKRKKHPFQDCWAIPGGFVNMEESLKEGAKRELREETGVCDVTLKQLHAFGDVHRDPRMRVISIAYMALIPWQTKAVQAGDDAKEAMWFSIKQTKDELVLCSEDQQHSLHYVWDRKGYRQISSHGLAFDHLDMLTMALQTLCQSSL